MHAERAGIEFMVGTGEAQDPGLSGTVTCSYAVTELCPVAGSRGLG